MAARSDLLRATWNAKGRTTASCICITVLVLILTTSTFSSDKHQVEKAVILERGIFQAISGGPPVGHSTVGPVAKVREVSLVQSTTTIPAQKAVRFGLRYAITGNPSGGRVDVTIVTRFPEAGLLDPISGIRHHQSEYTMQAVIGAAAYREFRFDRSWEMVPGQWVFEFWHDGKMIGSQTFCVIEETKLDAANSLGGNRDCAPAVNVSATWTNA